MNGTFGEALRTARHTSGRSLRDIAEYLGFSTTYVSDVELGKRAPFDTRTILDLAAFLSADDGTLLRAAARSRGYIEVPVSSRMADEVVDALVILWRAADREKTLSLKKLRGFFQELA